MMKAWIVAGFVFVDVSLVWAQPRSTVQLPTIQTFSITTSVLAPDSGAVHAGGIGRGWSRRRCCSTPLLPLAGSSEVGRVANGVSVHATIHDLAAMDETLLRQWRQGRAAADVMPAGKPAVASDLVSVASVRRRVEVQEAKNQSKAVSEYRSGRRWEARGNVPLAVNYYRRALRRGIHGSLRDATRAGLRRLGANP